MKIIIIQHIEIIGMLISIFIMILIAKNFPYWQGTKYQIISDWYLIIIAVIGAGYVGAEVAKWIIK